MNEATAGAPLDARKRELRIAMRAMRRALPDRRERSARIVAHLVAISAVARAARVHTYSAVPGEVETTALVDWCRRHHVEVATPDDEVVASWADVIVVPGTAFTASGDRLGQGGGWYDRFLADRRPDALTVGIAFSPQIVDALPIASHDVPMDCVVTEDGPRWRDGTPSVHPR